MGQLLTIELFGQSHTLKAETESARAEEVAGHLVKEVEKVEQQQTERLPAMSELAMLILSALNIADENYELKANQSRFLDEMKSRTTNLIRMLDDCVP